MKTIELEAEVTAEGKLSLDIQLSPDIKPGNYHILVVVEAVQVGLKLPLIKHPLEFNTWAWTNWPVDATFSREELYDDDGR